MDVRRFYLELIYAILVFFSLQILASGDMFEEDDDDSGSWSRCPWLRTKLKNGRVKIRSRGRIAKFQCEPGYELAGKRFATCVRGQWNNPVPVCVSRGCYRPPHVNNGRVTLMYRGAVLMYDCLPGYTLDGSSSIYCDGRKWSSVPPSCVVSTSDPQTSCDFEDPDLCGWSQDPTHEFDWKRNQFSTPSGHAGTGPSYDHSFGEGKGGFYLYMEASAPRVVNDTARLFSPVYPSEYSGGCFIFWYHMFGSTTGGLRVFVKPESQVFGELPAAWVVFGDQGNHWHRGNVTVPHFSERFQIIIEGIRGTSYLGDTAIDDVTLFTVDCESVGNSTDNTSISETVSDSCRGRCRESDYSPVCGCNDDCVWSNSCCEDFASICTKSSQTEDENKEEQAMDRTTAPTTDNDTLAIETTYITSSQAPFTSVSTSNFESTTTSVIPLTTVANEETGTLFTVANNTITLSSSTASSSTTSLKTTVSTTSSTIRTALTMPSNTPLTTSATTTSTTPFTTSTTESTTTSTKPPTTTFTKPPTTTFTKPPTTTSTSPSTTTSSTPSTTSTTPSTTSTTPSTTSATPSTTTTTTKLPISSLPTTMSTVTEKTQSWSTKPPIMVSNSPITYSTISPFSTLTTLIIPEVSQTTPSSVSEIPIVSTKPSSPETLSTRRRYNLRPRIRTSPMISPVTATISLQNYSTSSEPSPITSIKPFDKDTRADIPYAVKPYQSSSPLFTYRPPITSTEPQIWLQPSTPLFIPTTPRQLTRAKEPFSPTLTSLKTTRRFTSEERARTTEKSVSETEAHASKTSSTVSDDGQSAITIVSIIIVMLICITAGAMYFIRRRKAKALSKLGDDSEMRFLSENEVMEYSDSSALDRNVFNP